MTTIEDVRRETADLSVGRADADDARNAFIGFANALVASLLFWGVFCFIAYRCWLELSR